MRKRKKHPLLSQISIVQPCEVKDFQSIAESRQSGWYCNKCEKEVYDLSRLTENEIIDLTNRTNGNFCASIQKNKYGDIIIKEEPSQSFLTASALFATTTLLASTALAQELPAKPPTASPVNVNTPEVPPEAAEIGKVAVPVSNDVKADCGSQEKGSISPTPDTTPAGDTNNIQNENTLLRGGVSIPQAHMRGKVAIHPIQKSPEKSKK